MPPHPQIEWRATLRNLAFPKHYLSYGHSSRTFAELVQEVLHFEAVVWADRILRWIGSIEILSKKKMMTGSQASKENVIFSVVDLLCITRSLSMLVDQGNAFVCSQRVANHFIYNQNRTRKRNRKDCVCGNGGGFFDCFVGQIITWNGRTTKSTLNEDGR